MSSTGDTPSRPEGDQVNESTTTDDTATGQDAEATVVVPGGYDLAPTSAGSATEPDDADAPDAEADSAHSAEESTRVMPVVDDTAGTEAPESRRVTRDELYARADRRGEQERLAAVRAEHQAATTPATAAAAGATGTAGTAASATTTPSGKKRKPPRTTDKFLPSLGLFALRVTAAAVMGVHGVQKLLTMDQTAQFFGTLTFFGTALPYPSVLALITGVAEALIAVALLFGFLTRIAGFGMLLISLGALLMVKMTVVPNPLAPGAPSGFSGETELLLAGAAILLLCVGGGSWALDRIFRRGRYLTADDLTA